MPELPTIAEAALPGYELPNWVGLVAPANTPREIIAKLNAVMVKMATDQELAKRMTTAGADMAATTPQAFGEIVAKGYGAMGMLIAVANIKTE